MPDLLTKKLSVQVDLVGKRIKSVNQYLVNPRSNVSFGPPKSYGNISGNKFVVTKGSYQLPAGEYSFTDSAIFVVIEDYDFKATKKLPGQFGAVEAYIKNLLNTIFKQADKIIDIAKPYDTRKRDLRKSGNHGSNAYKQLRDEIIAAAKRAGLTITDNLADNAMNPYGTRFNEDFCIQQLRQKGFTIS